MRSRLIKLLILILLALIPVCEIFAQARPAHAPATGTKKPAVSKPKAATTKAKPKFVAGTQQVPATQKEKPPQQKMVQDDPDYNNAIGLRAGGTSGLTVKHFFNSGNALEGILGVWPNAIGLTGLYENYAQVGDVHGLNFYFGGGGHFNYSTGRLYAVYREGDRYYTYRKNYPGIALGIDLVGGIEYKIPELPFALSLDIKPFIEVNNAGAIFTALDPGLGIKITF